MQATSESSKIKNMHWNEQWFAILVGIALMTEWHGQILVFNRSCAIKVQIVGSVVNSMDADKIMLATERVNKIALILAVNGTDFLSHDQKNNCVLLDRP